MRRNAVMLLASIFMVSTLTGCSLFGGKKKDATAEVYDPTLDQTPAATTPYPSYPSSGMSPSSSGGGRSHTVQKGDTLYKLARTYYNDQHRWKDIYEANRAELGDPNKIRVGQRLVIP